MTKPCMAVWLVAGAVALASAVHADDPAAETRATSYALKHRWTFNEDYKDSVTGSEAMKIGTNIAVADGVVKMTGNANGAGSLNLGTGIMPPGAATVEIWATHTAVRKYSRIFDYGPNNQNYFTLGWSTGTDINKDFQEIKAGNTAILRKDNTLFPFSIGVKYHISVVFTPKTDGSCDVRWAKRNAATGALEKSGSGTAANWALGQMFRPIFYLGHSQYSADFDASAEYDEVRIWNGALTDEQLAANAGAGPNTLPENVAVAITTTTATPLYLRHRWSFSGNYDNGVAGAPAAAKAGTMVAFADDNTCVELSGTKNATGDSANGGYVTLGTGILPSDSATIEIWATPTAANNWARVFDYGSSERDYFCLTWSSGSTYTTERAGAKVDGAETAADGTMGPYELGVKYHISATFSVNGSGKAMVHFMRRNAKTGMVEKSGTLEMEGSFVASYVGGL